MTLAAKVRYAPMTCGFCATGHHNHCPRAVHNGNGSLVLCYCDQPYCGSQVTRCLDCRNEADGEVGSNWRCIDRDACADAQRKRLDANPYLRLVREVERRVTETQTTEKAEKQAKTPRPQTTCVHCGEPTKGGKFLPGHDAKYVAKRVEEVLAEGSTLTEDAVLEQMGSRGLTETLQKKFSKSVSLARETAAKKLAAKEAADEAAKAKANAEAATKAAKEEVADQPPTADSDAAADAPKPAAPAKKAAATKNS